MRKTQQKNSKRGFLKSPIVPFLLLVGTIYLFWIAPLQRQDKPIYVEFEHKIKSKSDKETKKK